MSNRINLTPKRLDKIRKLVRRGYSMKSVSLELRMHYDTLLKKLKEIDFDVNAEKNIGIDILRGSVLDDISEIDEADKRVSAKMKYLDRYDKSINDESGSVDVNVSVDVGSVADKILDELSE